MYEILFDVFVFIDLVGEHLIFFTTNENFAQHRPKQSNGHQKIPSNWFEMPLKQLKLLIYTEIPIDKCYSLCRKTKMKFAQIS